ILISSTNGVAPATFLPPLALALKHGDKEAVGAVARRGHEQGLLGAVGRLTRHIRQRLRPERAPGDDPELRVPGEEGLDLIAVLGREHRAGDVGEPPALLHERRPLLEHRLLFLDPRLEHLRGEPPLGVGTPPPYPRAGAWRIDDDEV